MADGPVALTFKGGQGYDEPWLVLSGTVQEIDAQVAALEAKVPGIGLTVQGVLERIKGNQKVGPDAAAQIVQQAVTAPVAVAQPTAPVVQAPVAPTAPTAPVVPIATAPSAQPALLGPVMAPTPGQDYQGSTTFGHQCPKCGVTTYLQPAGTNQRTGESFDAYWRCPNAKNHPKRNG